MNTIVRLATAVALSLSGAAASAAAISGTISTTDYLTTDSTGDTFYVDYFAIGVSADATLELTLDSTSALDPWFLVLDTATSGLTLPAADWEDPDDFYSASLFAGGANASGGSVSYTLSATGGVVYQVALTSSTYVSLDPTRSLGGYLFSIGGANGDAAPSDLTVVQLPDPDTTAVPAPAPLGLAGLGLLGLAWIRRRS